MFVTRLMVFMTAPSQLKQCKVMLYLEEEGAFSELMYREMMERHGPQPTCISLLQRETTVESGAGACGLPTLQPREMFELSAEQVIYPKSFVVDFIY